MTTRDLMASDTEPTDEELATVMRAALDIAMKRKAIADAWVAERLEEASRIAREQSKLFSREREGS